MDAVSLLSALEALDSATLSPLAGRLTYLARVAERSSQLLSGSARLSLEDLPDALIARVFSFLGAPLLSRVVRLSTAFSATHTPAAMAVRVHRLHLNPSHDYQKPIDLLLGEAEAAAAQAHVSGHYGIDTSCHAKARV